MIKKNEIINLINEFVESESKEYYINKETMDDFKDWIVKNKKVE